MRRFGSLLRRFDVKMHLFGLCAVLLILSLTAACAPVQPAAVQSDSLVVRVLYPNATSTVEMGQQIKGIVKVLDQQGNPVREAQVSLSVIDLSGKLVGSLPATVGAGDLYRTDSWVIPHKLQQGAWIVQADAATENERGMASATFRVNNSISEDLLGKYGFWIEAPTLRGITPFLVKEQGDAQNGVIIWGGQRPSQHIFPENWVELQWREGDFKLSTGDQVRAFMLGTLGDLGFTPVRELGPFEQVKYKNWDAWQVKVRGQFSRYDGQWMIFYAPEVGKTYALGTTVVLAPVGIDAHQELRHSFEVHPEIQTEGEAPEALPRLLPAPELISPELGTRVMGADEPIILSWRPVKELAPDEYYRVRVDYNYDEANPSVYYATRDTHMALPASLYDTPNCGVFNWQITLMQQTGMDDEGQPKGKPLSYSSLYWYVEWLHRVWTDAPFKPLCPNPQT